jgi:hypothetical protein
MQTRRQDPENKKFRQDAYASSVEHDRGILGNLVAARTLKFSDPEEVAMAWWLQQVSWRAGGLENFVEKLIEQNRKKVTQAVRVETGPSWEDRKWMKCGATSETATTLADSLKRSLVDPGSRSLRDKSFLALTGIEFPDLWLALSRAREEECASANGQIVETEITRTVNEELNFALQSRSFILIEGREGIGKTEAAKVWCAQNPGKAVYVRLESGSEETTLFRSIARAIGTACSAGLKAFEMRVRIQDALQSGQIMVVLDEAHFLWPQSDRSHRSAPKRVDWVRTTLVDFGVPVALISTPQYFSRACEKFLKGGWNANQIQRRLTHTVTLPDQISASEMKAVAKRYFPQASSGDLTRIALTSARELGFLTVIMHLRKRVDFLAAKHPGRAEPEYIDEALKVYATPAPLPAPRKTPADRLQSPGMTHTAPALGRAAAPVPLSRIHREQPVLTVT